MRLFFSRSYVGEFVKDFYWASFLSLFPLERLVYFSALWTYPCSEPIGFFFCLEFAERLVEHATNMITKAAELPVQILILAVPINLRVIKTVSETSVKMKLNSVSNGFFNVTIYCILWSILTPCNILKPLCLLFDSCGHVTQVYTTGQYRPHMLQTRAAGECFHCFFEFSSVPVTRKKLGEHVFYFF